MKPINFNNIKYSILKSHLNNKQLISFLKGIRSKYLKFQYNQYAKKNLPINNNQILYESYWGRGMVDNPYAIFLYLLNDPSFKNYQHIWVLNDLEYFKNSYLASYKKYLNVLFVQYQSKEYYEMLYTSKYLINNVTFSEHFQKRTNQIYINTWHGTPLKNMGYDTNKPDPNLNNIVQNLQTADYLLSANNIMTRMYENSFRLKNKKHGQILEQAYPRNDLLIKTEFKTIADKLYNCGVNLSEDKLTILYAPTWKTDSSNNTLVNRNELLLFKESLSKKMMSISNHFQILIKPHQFVYEYLKNDSNYSDCLVPSYIDTNELLSIVDVLITDYSSIFFDYMYVKKPIVFYMPDQDLYEENRGLQIPLDNLPGPIYKSIDDIANFIQNLPSSYEIYPHNSESLFNAICSFPIGDGSKKVVQKVFTD